MLWLTIEIRTYRFGIYRLRRIDASRVRIDVYESVDVDVLTSAIRFQFGFFSAPNPPERREAVVSRTADVAEVESCGFTRIFTKFAVLFDEGFCFCTWIRFDSKGRTLRNAKIRFRTFFWTKQMIFPTVWHRFFSVWNSKTLHAPHTNASAVTLFLRFFEPKTRIRAARPSWFCPHRLLFRTSVLQLQIFENFPFSALDAFEQNLTIHLSHKSHCDFCEIFQWNEYTLQDFVRSSELVGTPHDDGHLFVELFDGFVDGRDDLLQGRLRFFSCHPKRRIPAFLLRPKLSQWSWDCFWYQCVFL